MPAERERLALLVEDARTTRRIVREMLEDLGFSVVETAGAQQARDWVAHANQTPSLALIDWGLPDGSGLDLIREWRELPSMRRTPLLMLTIRSEREAVREALDAGADEFLMKPCTIEALEDKLALLEFTRLPRSRAGGSVTRARPQRVLIVDDSAVARRAITMALEGHPDIEIIGHAADGEAGLARVLEDQPDVVILDLEMPKLGGLDVLRKLRELSPHTAVVVFSTHIARGAPITIEALLLGARDCLCKPAQLSNFQSGLDWIRDELSRRIELLTVRGPERTTKPLTPATPATPAMPQVPAPIVTHPVGGPRPELIVIAASTGGPLALRELLGSMPGAFPVPIVIVQHLPEDFVEPFAAQLDRGVALHVEVARHGATPEPGCAYVAPAGSHLVVRRGPDGQLRFARDDSPKLGGCRPAADLLFASAAKACGAACLGLVLSGMGSDGCEGARELIAAGGRVFAQDRATSAVWSMPGAVVRSGLATQIIALEHIGPELVATVNRDP